MAQRKSRIRLSNLSIAMAGTFFVAPAQAITNQLVETTGNLQVPVW